MWMIAGFNAEEIRRARRRQGLVVTPETLAELQPLAAAASPGHLQSLFEIFLRVETEVRQTTFPRMLLELAVLRAVGLEEVDRIETLLAAVGIAGEAIREILMPHRTPAPFTLVVLLGVGEAEHGAGEQPARPGQWRGPRALR